VPNFSVSTVARGKSSIYAYPKKFIKLVLFEYISCFGNLKRNSPTTIPIHSEKCLMYQTKSIDSTIKIGIKVLIRDPSVPIFEFC